MSSIEWAVGIGLCFEIAERKSGLVEEDFRPGLLDDAVEIVTSSARLAGYYAATSAGLLVYTDNPDDLRPLLTNDDAVAFLVHASRAIPNTFGPDVTARLEFFRYPDAPDESQYHVVIDSPLRRDQANERLDALCDDWWDAAAAGLGVDLFPVLGVID